MGNKKFCIRVLGFGIGNLLLNNGNAYNSVGKPLQLAKRLLCFFGWEEPTGVSGDYIKYPSCLCLIFFFFSFEIPENNER
jgi:hypothetical protein